MKPTSSYIKPSVLWWAFNAASARKQALAAGVKSDGANADPTMDDRPAVVLIDEIDKADPDVPNDLLVPVGSLTFYVAETDTLVESITFDKPLLCITTNEERDLPPRFSGDASACHSLIPTTADLSPSPARTSRGPPRRGAERSHGSSRRRR